LRRSDWLSIGSNGGDTYGEVRKRKVKNATRKTTDLNRWNIRKLMENRFHNQREKRDWRLKGYSANIRPTGSTVSQGSLQQHIREYGIARNALQWSKAKGREAGIFFIIVKRSKEHVKEPASRTKAKKRDSPRGTGGSTRALSLSKTHGI